MLFGTTDRRLTLVVEYSPYLIFSFYRYRTKHHYLFPVKNNAIKYVQKICVSTVELNVLFFFSEIKFQFHCLISEVMSH